MKIRVLALDLERTLISDALHREPRPELHDFLLYCTQHFERIALFTSVSRRHAIAALQELAGQGVVPQPFLDKLEYVEWEGWYKDLAYIPDASPEEVILIDDDEGWVRPDQRGQWISIAEYDPYLVKGEDREFARIQQLLEARLQETLS